VTKREGNVKAKGSNDAGSSSELAELIAIKRLMVFQLLRSGASQQEVAAALGVGQSSISRMFSAASLKGSRKAGN
jgi:hypothetical protein